MVTIHNFQFTIFPFFTLYRVSSVSLDEIAFRRKVFRHLHFHNLTFYLFMLNYLSIVLSIFFSIYES